MKCLSASKSTFYTIAIILLLDEIASKASASFSFKHLKIILFKANTEGECDSTIKMTIVLK
jgi:hypothetical protein